MLGKVGEKNKWGSICALGRAAVYGPASGFDMEVGLGRDNLVSGMENGRRVHRKMVRRYLQASERKNSFKIHVDVPQPEDRRACDYCRPRH